MFAWSHILPKMIILVFPMNAKKSILLIRRYFLLHPFVLLSSNVCTVLRRKRMKTSKAPADFGEKPQIKGVSIVSVIVDGKKGNTASYSCASRAAENGKNSTGGFSKENRERPVSREILGKKDLSQLISITMQNR